MAYGASVDWAYEGAGIKYSFALELREKLDSYYGFLLPQDQILPTARETYAGLSAMARTISKEFRVKGKRGRQSL